MDPPDKSVAGALTPYTGKEDDAKVAVGTWSFEMLINLELLVDIIRIGIILFTGMCSDW